MALFTIFKTKYLVVFSIVTLIFSPVFGDDFFCEDQNQQVKFNAFIPLTAHGNLAEYLDTNDKGRIKTIMDLSKIASELSQNSGDGLEATAEFLSFINGYYDYMLRISEKDIGKVLSDQIVGSIDEKYRQTNTVSRKLEFVTTDLYYNKNRIFSQENNLPDFTAYGSFAYVDDNKITISFKIIRLSDGASRSFVSTGDPLQAANHIADMIFDAIQFPVAKDIFNPFSEFEWIGANNNQIPADIRLSDSLNYCVALGSRLPTKIELIIANQLGPYVSGVKIYPSFKYAVTDDGEVSYLTPQTGECLKQTNDQTLAVKVYCLKEASN